MALSWLALILTVVSCGYSPRWRYSAYAQKTGPLVAEECSPPPEADAPIIAPQWLGFGRQRAHLFNADSTLLVTLDDTASIRIWGAPLRELRGVLEHGPEVDFAAFSPVSPELLLTTSTDKTVRLWDLATSKYKLLGQADQRVTSATFSADGQLLAVPFSNEVRLLKLDGSVRNRLAGQWTQVLFSPDGHTITTQSLRDGVTAWDGSTGAQLWHIKVDRPSNFAFSRDSSELLWSTNDSTFHVTKARTGVERTAKSTHGKVEYLGFSKDGRILVVGQSEGLATLDYPSLASRGELTGFVFSSLEPSQADTLLCYQMGTIVLVDIRKPAILGRWSESNTSVQLAISPDGVRGSTLDHHLTLWYTEMPGSERFAHGVPVGAAELSVYKLAWSPDGETLATISTYGPASSEAMVRLWNTRKGDVVFTLNDERAPDSGFDGVIWSPRGDRIALSSGVDVTLWDSTTRKRIVDLENENNVRTSHPMTFSPDGQRLATSGGNKGQIRIWSATDGALLRTIEGNGASVYSLSFSPDGSLLLAGTGGGFKVFDASGTERTTLQTSPPESAVQMVWLADSSTVLMHSGSATVRAFDVKAQKEIWNFKLKDAHRIWEFALGPKGLLAVSTDQGQLELWDLATRKRLRSIPGEAVPVTAVAWNPRAPILAAARGDIQLARASDETTLLMRLAENAGLTYSDSGLFSGHPDTFPHRLRFRQGDNLFRGKMLDADDVQDQLYRPKLVQEFMAGCPLRR